MTQHFSFKKVKSKVYLLIAMLSMYMFMATASFAQLDIKVVTASPSDGQVIKSGSFFPVTLRVINKQPAIMAGWTYVVKCYVITGSKTDTIKPLSFTGQLGTINPNDSISITINYTYNFTAAHKGASFCQSAYIQGQADPTPGDNVSCSTVDLELGPGGPTGTCLPPSSISVSNITHNSATLQWPADATASAFEYAAITSKVSPSLGFIATTNSVTVNNLRDNKTYYAHVRSTCTTGGYSAWTVQSFNTLVAPTGVDNMDVLDKIAVSPNPATDNITIAGITKDDKIQLVNIIGKTVVTEIATNKEMNVKISELPAGIYFLQVRNKDFIKTIKVEKQ